MASRRSPAQDCPTHDPVRADLQEIDRAGNRAAALTRQLLAFSRKQVLQPIVFSPNAVISDMVGMLSRLIGANIELRLEPDINLACVRADCGQTEQVVLNLVVNARDAMPQGGTITIATRNVEIAGGDHAVMPARALRDAAGGRYAASEWTRRHAPGFSSRSSRRRRPAKAPAWGLPPSTASSSKAAARSKSTANVVVARRSGSISRAWTNRRRIAGRTRTT